MTHYFEYLPLLEAILEGPYDLAKNGRVYNLFNNSSLAEIS